MDYQSVGLEQNPLADDQREPVMQVEVFNRFSLLISSLPVKFAPEARMRKRRQKETMDGLRGDLFVQKHESPGAIFNQLTTSECLHVSQDFLTFEHT